MTEGHPCFVANNGRLGFGVTDYRAFAPEAGQPVRLAWLAVRKDRATISHSETITYDELLRDELGDDGTAALRRADPGRRRRSGRLPPACRCIRGSGRTRRRSRSRRTSRSGTSSTSARVTTTTRRSSRSGRSSTGRTRSGNYVKTALSVLNMGFMRGLSPTYMEKTPAINDWVYGPGRERRGAEALRLLRTARDRRGRLPQPVLRGRDCPRPRRTGRCCPRCGGRARCRALDAGRAAGHDGEPAARRPARLVAGRRADPVVGAARRRTGCGPTSTPTWCRCCTASTRTSWCSCRTART